MATSAAPVAAVRAAFSGLIDYAGLFPPAQLAMDAAVAEYVEARRGPYAWMLARFICAESRLRELLEIASEPVPISVIVQSDGGRAWFEGVQPALERIARHAASGARIEMLEVPLPRLLSLRETYDAAIGQFAAALSKAGLRSLPAFVELPRDARWDALLPGALAAIGRHRFGAKLRCGGADASAVPSSLEVARFMKNANEEGVPFKATAGLHHPIRGYDENRGFIMHGFLNLLAAAALAREGSDLDTLITVLEDEDASDFSFDARELKWKDRPISDEVLTATRREGFISYGSCSFDEPIADLKTLGWIAS